MAPLIIPAKLIDKTFVRVNIRIITNNNPVQKVFNLCACGQNMDTGGTRLVFDHELYKNQKL